MFSFFLRFSLDEVVVLWMVAMKARMIIVIKCFVKPIHVELIQDGSTCLMKEGMLLCLQWAGITFEQNFFQLAMMKPSPSYLHLMASEWESFFYRGAVTSKMRASFLMKGATYSINIIRFCMGYSFQFIEIMIMRSIFKVIWLISIYGVIFFTFTSITFSVAPQFYNFQLDEEDVNTSIIMVILYLVVVLVLSVVWCREREKAMKEENDIEMRELESRKENEEEMIIE